MNHEICDRYKIDYRAGAERFRGDEDMYGMVLTAFLSDDTFARAQAAYAAGDPELLFTVAHELKGVSGNMSLTELYEASCSLVEYLRVGGRDREKLAELFAAVETAHERSCGGIRLALAQ